MPQRSKFERGKKRTRNSHAFLLYGFLAIWFAISFFVLPLSAKAQGGDAHDEVWPEAWIWLKTSEDQRLFIYNSYTMSLDDDMTKTQIGAGYSWSLLQNDLALLGWMVGRESEEDFRTFTARAGFRYGWSLHDDGKSYKESQIPLEFFIRWHIFGQTLLTDRNRLELRTVNDDRFINYRNRLIIERQIRIGTLIRMKPYLYAEIFYDNRYQTFNRTQVAIGATISPFSWLTADGYYAHINDTRAEIKYTNAVGLILNFYFDPFHF
jgi:hypothetical protein